MPALGLKLRLNRITARILSVLTTNLQMWHKFTASPWTGANRLPDSSPVGTNTGALFTGRALDFDGVNDWVDCGNPNITCRSLVLYINPDVTTDEIMRLTSAINVSIVSGTLTATGWTSPNLYVNGVTGTSVSASTWHQIAITSATGFTVNDLELGRTSASAWYAGLIANVKIFSVELTAAQVAELYANPEQALPTGVTSGQLTGWWLISAGASTGFILDGSENRNNGDVAGAVFVSNVPSPVYQTSLTGSNRPMFFDGTNDQVNFGNNCNVSGDKLTIFIHIANFKQLANNQYILAKSNTNATVGYVVNIMNTANNIRFGVYTTALRTVQNAFPAKDTVILVCRYDGAELSMFYDGVKAANTLAVTGNITTSTDALTIGSLAGSLFSQVQVLKAAIWNKNLSDAEILAISSNVNFDLSANSGNYVSASNILGYWLNTGNTNTNWLDLSSNGANGTVSGSPAVFNINEGFAKNVDILGRTLANVNNGAFIGDGVSYAEVADAASLDITSTITLEAWVRPFTVATAQTIIGKNSAYALNITSGAKLQFQRWSGTTSGTLASSTSLVANAWRHVAITYNGTTTLIYINGVLDTTSTAISGAIDTTSTAVLLGALTTTTQQFSGYIDNVRIYSAALTAAQIAGNYKAEKGGYN